MNLDNKWKSFLDKVNPEYAVILTGKNSYGHPHAEVLSKLESANIEIHRSDECGDVIFKSTGEGVSTGCNEGTYLANDKESREEEERKAEEERIVAEAKEEAARIIQRANSEIELEKKKAADDIKKEIINVATLMANKVVAASIDAKTQDALIEETLGEIGDKTWLS